MIEVRISYSEIQSLPELASRAYVVKKLRDAGIPVVTTSVTCEYRGVNRGRMIRSENYETGELVFLWSDKKRESLQRK